KLVRHLNQDARAIPRVDLRSRGAAVVQVAEDLQRVRHDFVRFAALHVDHEADAAGLVLEEWIVKTLFRRQAGATTRRTEVTHVVAGRDGPLVFHWEGG